MRTHKSDNANFGSNMKMRADTSAERVEAYVKSRRRGLRGLDPKPCELPMARLKPR